MKKGFTLLELLLSIALITVLVGVSLPTWYTLFPVNDLDVAKNQVAQSFGRAAFLSSASDADSTWGVKVQTGSVVIFQGTSYSGRTASFDEIYPISNTIVISGLDEVVFNKLTGLPQTTGTTTLTSVNGDIRTITINSKGTVNY